MDNLARLMAALSELTIDELRLVLRFAEFLVSRGLRTSLLL